MSDAKAPFLLVEGDCVQWKRCTLRERRRDERFLEEVVAKHPQLLGLEDRRTSIRGAYVPFRQRALETPQGRTVRPDIVFLTESGHIVVVEVKLADNPELKDRSVIAQLLDYAASLANYTEGELAELFGGNPDDGFPAVVRKHFPNAERIDELAEVLLERIQRAEMHLVVACDGAPEGLHDLVRGVSNQSALGDFELRVVELIPHTIDGQPGLLFLPAIPVRTEIVARTAVNITYAEGQPKPGIEIVVTSLEETENKIRDTRRGMSKPMRPELAEAVAAYEEIADAGLHTRGTADNYRQIRPQSWPGPLHYEFICAKGAFRVDLHLEHDVVRPLGKLLETLTEQLRSAYPAIQWDPTWSVGRGRITLPVTGKPPKEIANAMKQFIADTRPAIDKAWAELQTNR